MNRGPQLIKVCSPRFVRELVKRALPGLALTHLPNPPAAISTRRETQYFGISRGGPCWDHMVSTRRSAFTCRANSLRPNWKSWLFWIIDQCLPNFVGLKISPSFFRRY